MYFASSIQNKTNRFSWIPLSRDQIYAFQRLMHLHLFYNAVLQVLHEQLLQGCIIALFLSLVLLPGSGLNINLGDKFSCSNMMRLLVTHFGLILFLSPVIQNTYGDNVKSMQSALVFLIFMHNPQFAIFLEIQILRDPYLNLNFVCMFQILHDLKFA